MVVAVGGGSGSGGPSHLQPAALRHELRVEAFRRLLQRAHVVHHADLGPGRSRAAEFSWTSPLQNLKL